jgi:hypothetical protein
MLDFIIIFFAGVLTTLTLIAIIKQYNKLKHVKKIIVKQSEMFMLIKNFLPEFMFKPVPLDSQSLRYEYDRELRYIEMSDHNAYWIDKNKIYYAEVTDGRFNPDDAKLAEMENLSEKRVSEVLYIYNSLKNGS